MAVDVGVRRLVIDAELLARLGPDSPRSAWERDLRRSGLYDLDPPDGPVGDALRALQRTLQEWPRTELTTEQATLPWWAPVALVLATLFAGAITGWDVPWMLALGVLGGIGVMLMRRRADSEGPEPQAGLYGERAAALLRNLLARSFVAAAGEVVVENTPHVDYLRLRSETLASAVRVVDARTEEIERTVAHVRAANTRMGRPADDIETDRLQEVLDREQLARVRILEVRDQVERRLAEVLDRLEQLRAAADRQALSERVQRMAAGDHPVARHVAEIEVDVAEVERAIHDLALEAREADARTTALLEVVGAGRTWSASRSAAKVRDSERA